MQYCKPCKHKLWSEILTAPTAACKDLSLLVEVEPRIQAGQRRAKKLYNWDKQKCWRCNKLEAEKSEENSSWTVMACTKLNDKLRKQTETNEYKHKHVTGTGECGRSQSRNREAGLYKEELRNTEAQC